MRVHQIGPATLILMGDCAIELEPNNPMNPLVGGA